MFGLLSQIAIEAHYHKSCYCKYTVWNCNSDETEKSYKEKELESFKRIVVRLHGLSESAEIIEFTEILSNMKHALHELGTEITMSTKTTLRRKTEATISDIKLINVDDRLYLYSTTLSLESVRTKFIQIRLQMKIITECNSSTPNLTKIKKLIDETGTYVKKSTC